MNNNFKESIYLDQDGYNVFFGKDRKSKKTNITKQFRKKKCF